MRQSILFISFLISFLFAQAQNDSLSVDTTTIESRLPKQTTLMNVESPKNHSPVRASLLSMALPGLGQIYNASAYRVGNEKRYKKVLRYSKVPLIYGAGAFFVYNIVYHHNLYSSYQEALYNRQTPNYSGVDQYTGILTDDGLRTRKNNRKLDRDNNIIYLLLLYTANILDANVGAHLIDFKISESLIMSYRPTVIPTMGNRSNIGLALNFQIR